MTGAQMSLKLQIPVVLFSSIFSCAHTKHTQTCRPGIDLTKNMSYVLLRSSFPVAVYNRKSSRSRKTMDDQQQHWDIYCESIKVWMWMSVCYSFSVREGEKRGGRSYPLLHSISHRVSQFICSFSFEGNITKGPVPEGLLKWSAGKSSVSTHNHSINIPQLSNWFKIFSCDSSQFLCHFSIQFLLRNKN